MSKAIYIDACPIIDAVKYRRGTKLADTDEEGVRRKADCELLRRVFEAAKDGAAHLFTSTLTVAECVHAGEGEGAPHEETRALFIEFLTSGRIIELVEPDVFVAEAARDLRWTHGINLRGADAIHVATALSMKCGEFLTTDRFMKSSSKFAGAIPAIAALGLSVIRPSETKSIPDKYLQYDLEG